MQTYLSIDLDFWNRGKVSFPHMKRFLNKVITYVPKSKIFIVDSHEEMLPDVNNSGCDNLINVDWHSDISNRFDPFKPEKPWKRLNCGTWITFVKFRKTGMFTWIHPYNATERSERGYCHYPHTPKHNPFVHPKIGGWNATKQISSKNPEDLIDWSSVSNVGICFSFGWVKHPVIWDIAEKILGFRPEVNDKAKFT